jgi:uncharacterized protein YjbI with pentapeptide repeats
MAASSSPSDCPEPSLRPSAEPGEICGAAVVADDRCLGHLESPALDAYLAGLVPGSPVDARGVTFTEDRLPRLLSALSPPNGHPRLGDAGFRGAVFVENAYFFDATFTGSADFSGVTFTKSASFHRATFAGEASFDEVTFTAHGSFDRVKFTGKADFHAATFIENAYFINATFTESASINGVTFMKNADFSDATFLENADLRGAMFTESAHFNRATFTKKASFDRVTFAKDVAFGIATFTENAPFGLVTFGGRADFGSAKFVKDADFRGVTFTEAVNFDAAIFTKDASFYEVTFSRTVSFHRTTFNSANFYGAMFAGRAVFGSARFAQHVSFYGATFSETAAFEDAVFSSANFNGVAFAKAIRFEGTTFSRNADFGGATFSKDADFRAVTFSGDVDFRKMSALGVLRLSVSAARLDFGGAEVDGELLVEGAVAELAAPGLRASGRAALRLRGTRVDMEESVITGLFTVHGLREALPGIDESHILVAAGQEARPVRVTSLRGVDADRLVLTDVDLSECRFAGIQRLDQVKLDGRCTFATDPSGTRQVLVEEHYWRNSGPGRRAGRWTSAPDGVEEVGAERLQVLYRQLRKAFEEGKNEPGAADFYYGEMEMRRAAAGNRGRRSPHRSERFLLTAYWATSGYALRVVRALTCLALVVVVTIITLTLWGFPTRGNDLKADGSTTSETGESRPLTVVVHQSEAMRRLPDRIEKAVETTLNAVIFRAPDTELTTTGRYIDIAARLLGPLFLGFSLLAIRNRVKR